MVNIVVKENTSFQMVQSIKGTSQIICTCIAHDISMFILTIG